MINNYKDLTIAKFQELQNIDSSMEEIDIQVAIISILTDLTEDEVLNLPLPQYKKYAAQTAFLKTPPQTNKRIPNKVKLNGNEYVLIKDVSDMSAGQYIDYNQYLSSGEIDKMLPYILSSFLIPNGKIYGDYKVDDVANDIKKNLSVEEALSIADFFAKKSQTLTKATLFYLELKMKKAMKKTKDETVKKKIQETIAAMRSLRNLIKNGDGFRA